MDTARIREGIRKMRFSTILDRWDSGEMTQETAAELLGMSVRSFQRWRERYEADGEAGLVDRRGGPSPRRAPQEELERMLGLYRDKYADFTVKHFHEQMQKRHNYTLGYTVTQSHLHRAGLVRPAPKRSARRKKRPRRPMRGMMLHQDGSRHAWIEGLPAMDLIVTMDDATSEIYSMILVEEEGSASTFEALREVIGDMACSARSTPTAAAITSTPPRRAGRSRARSRRRSAEPWPISGSSTSAPVRRRRPFDRLRRRSERLFATCRTAAQGVAARRRAQRRGGQCLAGRVVTSPSTTPASPSTRNRRARPSSPTPRDVARNPVRRRGAHGRQRQHRRLERKAPAIAAEPPAPALRQGAGARARISRRNLCGLPGPHRLADYDAEGALRVPTAPKPGVVLGAVKDKPCRARLRASLTAPARDASSAAQAGTRKRPPSRTRKQPDPNPAIDAA